MSHATTASAAPVRPDRPATAVTAGLIQATWAGTTAAMRARLVAAIERAVASGANLIVLPELHEGPYFCQVEDTGEFNRAQPIPGEATAFWSAVAARLGVVLVSSLFERRAPGLFHNTAVVFDRDASIAGTYRKMHIPDDPCFYEKFYFTPGDLGFTPIDTSLGRLGVLVCWDQWYPEAARLMAMAGAEVLIYPTAIGWNPGDAEDEQARQREAWVLIQRSHAVANGIPVLSVNRTGHETDPSKTTAGIRFWGTTFAAGCQGELLAKAGTDADEVLVVTLDRARSDEVRRIWPYFRDRRIEAYADLTRRWRD